MRKAFFHINVSIATKKRVFMRKEYIERTETVFPEKIKEAKNETR